MATGILSEAAHAAPHTHQYRLPEADRRAILAGSEPVSTDLKIEIQYTEFLKKNNGFAFGQQAD